jgi:hypothetical protein
MNQRPLTDQARADELLAACYNNLALFLLKGAPNPFGTMRLCAKGEELAKLDRIIDAFFKFLTALVNECPELDEEVEGATRELIMRPTR